LLTNSRNYSNQTKSRVKVLSLCARQRPSVSLGYFSSSESGDNSEFQIQIDPVLRHLYACFYPSV